MDNNNNTSSNQDLTLKQASKMLRDFVRERNWDKYHTPRNLVMAMVGQVGEIAQIFQWKGEVEPGLKGFSDKEKVHVGEEIADVLSYLIRLSDVSGIDIEAALRDKLAKNRKKYPSEEIRANENLFLEIKQQRRIKRQEQVQREHLPSRSYNVIQKENEKRSQEQN